MKKLLCAFLSLLMLLSLSSAAFAVNEDVEGELVIYTSMYKEIVAMMDEALKAEPANGASAQVNPLAVAGFLQGEGEIASI